jgi:hypothetical protein
MTDNQKRRAAATQALSDALNLTAVAIQSDKITAALRAETLRALNRLIDEVRATPAIQGEERDDGRWFSAFGVKLAPELVRSWSEPTPAGFAFRVICVHDGVATVQTLQLTPYADEPALTAKQLLDLLVMLVGEGHGDVKLCRLVAGAEPRGELVRATAPVTSLIVDTNGPAPSIVVR